MVSTRPPLPIEWLPFLVSNAQHEGIVFVLLECDEIREAFDCGFADQR